MTVKHHRRCRCNNGGNEPRNIYVVEQKLERAWHLLTGTMHPVQIAKVLSKFLDPDWVLVAKKRKRRPTREYR